MCLPFLLRRAPFPFGWVVRVSVDCRVVVGDCLVVMGRFPDGVVDLVYADPPYNTGRDFGVFVDRWGCLEEYLEFMFVRLEEVFRVLCVGGWLVLHVDPRVSHYLKVGLDRIFGRENFVCEVVWCYPPVGVPPRFGFPWKHDVLLFFSKGVPAVWSQPFGPMSEATLRTFNKVDSDGRRFAVVHGSRSYLDENRGRAVPSWWDDIGAGSSMPRGEVVHGRFPTQKPLKLLDRVVEACSVRGGVVFDPFCGSGSALVSARRLGRRAVGCDVSVEAVELARKRLSGV